MEVELRSVDAVDVGNVVRSSVAPSRFDRSAWTRRPGHGATPGGLLSYSIMQMDARRTTLRGYVHLLPPESWEAPLVPLPGPGSYHCEQTACTDAVWATEASNGHGSCGEQIAWVQRNVLGQSDLVDACDYVATQESTPECAPCGKAAGGSGGGGGMGLMSFAQCDEAPWSTVAATVGAWFEHPPNPLSGSTASVCRRDYAATVDASAEGGGGYSLDVSLPSLPSLPCGACSSGGGGVGTHVVHLAYTADAGSPNLTIGNASRTLALHVGHATGTVAAAASSSSASSSSSDPPAERWLDTVHLAPRDAASVAIVGQLASLLPEHGASADTPLDWSGAVLTLHDGLVASAAAATSSTSAAASSSSPASPVLQEATADADGHFAFAPVAGGTYTVRAVRGGGALVSSASTEPLTLVPTSLAVSTARAAAAALKLGVLLVTDAEVAAGTTRVVLRWRGDRSDLGLRAVFPYAPPCADVPTPTCAGPHEDCYYDPACADPSSDPHGGLGCNAGGVAQSCRFCGFGHFPNCPVTAAGAASAALAGEGEPPTPPPPSPPPPPETPTRAGLCEVFEGRPACADAAWSRPADATLHAEVVTFGAFAAANYSIFATAQPARLCRGYQLPSSASLPGGAAGAVDCVGNCATGRGYCYAAGDSCANCVLWDPDPAQGEVLCCAHGGPQGGKLPGTQPWQADGACSADSGARALGQCSSNASLAATDADGSPVAAAVALPAPSPLASGCGRLEGIVELVQGATPMATAVHLPHWRPTVSVEAARVACLHAAAGTPTVSFGGPRLNASDLLAWREALDPPAPCYGEGGA